MIKYPKIQSPWKRDNSGEFIDEFTNDCLRRLYDASWVAQVKYDGTNIRFGFNENGMLEVRGRTDKADRNPAELYDYMEEKLGITGCKISPATDWIASNPALTYFGEGMGPKIQGNPMELTDYEFILFDIYDSHQERWLLPWEVAAAADAIGFRSAETYSTDLPLKEAVNCVASGDVKYTVSGFRKLPAEGLVLKMPALALAGSGRVITKLKVKDFQ